MAATTRNSMRARWAPRSSAPVGQRTRSSPDYWALVVILVVMTAIIALTVWLASLGGGQAPVDTWMPMP
jgi:hypothetical protein